MLRTFPAFNIPALLSTSFIDEETEAQKRLSSLINVSYLAELRPCVSDSSAADLNQCAILPAACQCLCLSVLLSPLSLQLIFGLAATEFRLSASA